MDEGKPALPQKSSLDSLFTLLDALPGEGEGRDTVQSAPAVMLNQDFFMNDDSTIGFPLPMLNPPSSDRMQGLLGELGASIVHPQAIKQEYLQQQPRLTSKSKEALMQESRTLTTAKNKSSRVKASGATRTIRGIRMVLYLTRGALFVHPPAGEREGRPGSTPSPVCGSIRQAGYAAGSCFLFFFFLR